MNKMGKYTGIVKNWNKSRGYGFIAMLKKERHLTQNRLVFVHRSNVKEDYTDLFEQQVVTFDLYKSEQGYVAQELRQIRSGYKLFSQVRRGSEF